MGRLKFWLKVCGIIFLISLIPLYIRHMENIYSPDESTIEQRYKKAKSSAQSSRTWRRVIVKSGAYWTGQGDLDEFIDGVNRRD